MHHLLAYMDGGSVVATVLGGSMVVAFLFLLRGPVRHHDCDICGRHAACRYYQQSKAAVDYVCSDCRKNL